MYPLAKILVLSSLSLLSFAYRLNAAPAFEINSDSSVAVIVPEKSTQSARLAAEELARCLRKSLNCQVGITDAKNPPSDKTDVFIYVGPSKAAAELPLNSLKPEEFICKVDKQKIFLAGNDDPGDPYERFFPVKTPTMYAVYYFLRRFIGIRWLWPGESGEIIPCRNSVSIPYMNKTEGPSLPLRYTYYGGGAYFNARTTMMRWGRRNGMGAGLKGSVGHNSSKVIGDKYYAGHPEYYALINGKRLPLRKYGKICHSNSEVARIFADYGEKTDCDYFSVSPNDGPNWCECENCRKLDGGNFPAGRVFNFVNRVARELKRRNCKKLVAVYAYSDYANPPDNVEKLEDNVLLFIARGIYWNYSPTWEARFKKLFTEWSRKCSRIVLRDYKDNIRPMQLAPYPKLVDKYIKYLTRTVKNFYGINFSGDDSRDYSLLGPTMYVYARLLWNPQEKLEDILDEYYTAGWPASGRYVREYFEYFEERTGRMSREHDINLYSCTGGMALRILPRIFNREAFGKGKELLDRAYVAAKTKDEKQRVDFLRIGWQAAVNDMDYYNAIIALAKTGEPFAHIPTDTVKQVSPEEKKELVNRAVAAMTKRQAFLVKYKESEAIPSAPFANARKRLTGFWDSRINKLKAELESGSETGKHSIPDPWKFSTDPKERGKKEKWFAPEYDDSKWKEAVTTTFWENQGFTAYDGWAWYRKQVRFPEKKQREWFLVLGAVDESYELYINGKLIRRFVYDLAANPDSWKQPQKIALDDPGIKWGKDNLIAVAVHDRGGAGGIWRPCRFEPVCKNYIPQKMTDWEKNGKIKVVPNATDPGISEITVFGGSKLPAKLMLSVKGVPTGKDYLVFSALCPVKMEIPSSKAKSRFRIRVLGFNNKTLIRPVIEAGTSFLKKDNWITVAKKFRVKEKMTSLHLTLYFPYPGTYRLRNVTLQEAQ